MLRFQVYGTHVNCINVANRQSRCPAATCRIIWVNKSPTTHRDNIARSTQGHEASQNSGTKCTITDERKIMRLLNVAEILSSMVANREIFTKLKGRMSRSLYHYILLIIPRSVLRQDWHIQEQKVTKRSNLCMLILHGTNQLLLLAYLENKRHKSRLSDIAKFRNKTSHNYWTNSHTISASGENVAQAAKCQVLRI